MTCIGKTPAAGARPDDGLCWLAVDRNLGTSSCATSPTRASRRKSVRQWNRSARRPRSGKPKSPRPRRRRSFLHRGRHDQQQRGQPPAVVHSIAKRLLHDERERLSEQGLDGLLRFKSPRCKSSSLAYPRLGIGEKFQGRTGRIMIFKRRDGFKRSSADLGNRRAQFAVQEGATRKAGMRSKLPQRFCEDRSVLETVSQI